MKKRNNYSALKIPQYLNLKDLVILAGPSGGGKTTFMEELRSGNLSTSITSFLPVDAKFAPCVDVKFPDRIFETRLLSVVCGGQAEMSNNLELAAASCVIFHYAINRIESKSIDNIIEDDVLYSIISQVVTSISVINIRPSDNELAKFYESRSFERFETNSNVFVRIKRIFKFSKLRMLFRYRYLHAGSKFFSKWDLILRQLCDMREKGDINATIKIIDVEPILDDGAARGFSIKRVLDADTR